MIDQQNAKEAIVILPQSIGTTEVTGTIDTLGYDYCRIRYTMDTAAASSVPTTISVGEGDTTSAYTAIAALEAGGTGGPAIPAPNTSTGDTVVYDINLANGRKRYLNVGLASTTARLCAVTATLSRGATLPDTAAERGAKTYVAV